MILRLSTPTNYFCINSFLKIHFSDFTYKYNYDKTGNWIKQTAFDELEKGIPQIITERKIVYYD